MHKAIILSERIKKKCAINRTSYGVSREKECVSVNGGWVELTEMKTPPEKKDALDRPGTRPKRVALITQFICIEWKWHFLLNGDLN